MIDVRRIKNGVLASLAGGVAIGLLMQILGSIPMVAMLVGSQSVFVGWVVHMAISALFGVAYAILFGSARNQWATGLLYGFIWYLLGPLTLMPLFLGMGVQWSAAAVAGSISSLMGHLIYGLVVGLVYRQLEKPSGAPAIGAEKRAAR